MKQIVWLCQARIFSCPKALIDHELRLQCLIYGFLLLIKGGFGQTSSFAGLNKVGTTTQPGYCQAMFDRLVAFPTLLVKHFFCFDKLQQLAPFHRLATFLSNKVFVLAWSHTLVVPKCRTVMILDVAKWPNIRCKANLKCWINNVWSFGQDFPHTNNIDATLIVEFKANVWSSFSSISPINYVTNHWYARCFLIRNSLLSLQDGLVRSDTAVGTPDYISPEVSFEFLTNKYASQQWIG